MKKRTIYSIVAICVIIDSLTRYLIPTMPLFMHHIDRSYFITYGVLAACWFVWAYFRNRYYGPYFLFVLAMATCNAIDLSDGKVHNPFLAYTGGTDFIAFNFADLGMVLSFLALVSVVLYTIAGRRT